MDELGWRRFQGRGISIDSESIKFIEVLAFKNDYETASIYDRDSSPAFMFEITKNASIDRGVARLIYDGIDKYCTPHKCTFTISDQYLLDLELEKILNNL